MTAERGLEISHTTPMRWVLRYAPKLVKKVKSHLRGSNHFPHKCRHNRSLKSSTESYGKILGRFLCSDLISRELYFSLEFTTNMKTICQIALVHNIP
jgi:hypothetical protein